MPDLKLCRVCLNKNVKLYNYDRFRLKQIYERIITIRVEQQDNLPHYFCYECATMLYKFHKFKEKCHAAHEIFKDLLQKENLTYNAIDNLGRKIKGLQTNLGITIASDRVKTEVLKYRAVTKVPEIEKIEIDLSDYSDNNDLVNVDSDYELGEKAIDEKTVTDKTVVEMVYTENVVTMRPEIFINEDSDVVIDKEKQEELTKMIEIHIPKIEDNLEPISSDDEKVLALIKKPKYARKGRKRKRMAKKKEEKKRLYRRVIKMDDPETEKFKAETKKSKYLNPKHWLTVYLSEEEAEKNFKAKAEDPKFLKSPFRCYLCYKGFSKDEMLERHTKLRHAESLGAIECRFCHMRFKWKCFLNRHMPRHYTLYKCLRCNLKCNIESSAVFHEDYHNGVTRRCKHCGEEFRHSSTYYTHLRTHRSQHLCTLCGVSFVSAAGLHLHKLAKHVDAAKEVEETKEINVEANTYCERCDIKFETKAAFEEHLFHSAMHSVQPEAMAEDVPAPACPKVLRKRGTRTPRKPTTCGYCGKVFPTQAACMKHHHAEHPRTPFSPDGPRHICEICGVSLAPVSIQSHLNTHTRARLHTCAVCGVVFNSKSSWSRHQLTHTGEKPFACSLCDKRFTQSNSVKLHYKTFHLKEPYPKRNRRKKNEDGTLQDDFRAEAESDSLTLDRWR